MTDAAPGRRGSAGSQGEQSYITCPARHWHVTQSGRAPASLPESPLARRRLSGGPCRIARRTEARRAVCLNRWLAGPCSRRGWARTYQPWQRETFHIQTDWYGYATLIDLSRTMINRFSLSYRLTSQFYRKKTNNSKN